MGRNLYANKPTYHQVSFLIPRGGKNMSVIRIKKNKNYTVMSNYHLKEKNMSLKAKGLLSVMLSLPEDWDYSVLGLTAICKESKTSIQCILKELEEYKYLTRNRIQNEKGQFEYVYNIYENPQTNNQCTDKPCTEKPCTDKPCTEIMPQLNTKEQRTKKQSIKELNTKNIYIKDDLKNEFEMLWKEYPNKQGKEKAFKSYVKVRTKEKVDLSDIVNGLKRYLVYCKQNQDWYSPKNGSTWFNQCSWNDEYPIKEITTKDSANNMDFSDF